MRQLVWYGPKGVKIERKSHTQAPLSHDEVLVKMKAVGICGTDIHILKGNFAGANPPMILGHEMAGEVVDVGKEVQSVRPGDRVTVDSVVGCGQCALCRKGRTQFCAQGYEFGINHDGGCQDYLVVPERNAYAVPESISFEEAAVLDIEVWNAVRKCGIHPGDRVLVIGAGPIGLIACQLLRILGAQHVTLCEALHARLALAQDLRLADEYADAARNGPSIGLEYDVVIDCAGTSASTLHAFDAVRPCGRVLLFGVHEQAGMKIDINQIVLKDLVVFGALSDRTGWEDVIQLVVSGALDLKRLITHRFSLDDGSQAYSVVRNREDGLIKAVLLI
jgi:2-desacetyl-2-hydroxyethyl bacteriochlorophyllide A dehydrogenase